MTKIKIKELRKVEVSEKKLFRIKKEIKTYENIYELTLSNEVIDCKTWIRNIENDFIDIPEVEIIRISNIKKVFYKKEKDCFLIFFDWDKNDYFESYNNYLFEDEERLDYDEITERDLKYECFELENIFNYDFFKYFEDLKVEVIKREDELKNEEEKYDNHIKEIYPYYTKFKNKISTKILSRDIEVL